MSAAVERKMGAGIRNAERLVRTEMNFVQNYAARDSLTAAGLEEYEFIAVLDNRTTPRCQALDGTLHLLSEYSVGTNAPPMHPRCRSTISAVVEGSKRVARDKSGKNIKVPAEMKYPDYKKIYLDQTMTLQQWKKSRNSGKIQTGALNPNSPQAEEHAERYYGLVRSMKTDCARIAANTDFRVADIQRIKNHVFYNKHELYDGKIGRFDADYEMAQSWQRLIDGHNIQVRDIVLLNHEFLESVLEGEGLNAAEAHDMTEPIYNYAEELRKAGR